MQANFLHNMVQKIEKVYQPESKISYNESILIRRARKLLAQATNSTISNPLSEFAIRVSNKPLKKNTKSSNVLNTSHSHEV